MSDARYAMDASALLAIFFREPGAERVYDLLQWSVMSAVNLSEAVAKMQERGTPEREIIETVDDLSLRIVAFDTTQALWAGRMRTATRGQGMSLGDRACLALALAEGATAVTMDRGWAELDLPVQILVARP